ncbi:MAG: hypothetical protein JOS17DRAFT_513256 [Linnemannia elongata]|nr:MAG: hypothetical protein JOS17DRAFT_513256 [Linnemannia elongata]
MHNTTHNTFLLTLTLTHGKLKKARYKTQSTQKAHCLSKQQHSPSPLRQKRVSDRSRVGANRAEEGECLTAGFFRSFLFLYFIFFFFFLFRYPTNGVALDLQKSQEFCYPMRECECRMTTSAARSRCLSSSAKHSDPFFCSFTFFLPRNTWGRSLLLFPLCPALLFSSSPLTSLSSLFSLFLFTLFLVFLPLHPQHLPIEAKNED